MEFCKTCGSILFYFNDLGITKSYCKKCKDSKLSLGISFNEKHKKKEVGQGVIHGENPNANYNHKCKKCGHIGAQIIDVGVLISDEDYLTMIKCGKCGFAERVGRKVT